MHNFHAQIFSAAESNLRPAMPFMGRGGLASVIFYWTAMIKSVIDGNQSMTGGDQSLGDDDVSMGGGDPPSTSSVVKPLKESTV